MAYISSIRWYQSEGALDLGMLQGFRRRKRRKFEFGTIFRNSLHVRFQKAIDSSLTVGSYWNFYWRFSTYPRRVPLERSLIWALNKKIKILKVCCRKRYNFSNFRVFTVFCRFYSAWMLSICCIEVVFMMGRRFMLLFYAYDQFLFNLGFSRHFEVLSLFTKP